MAAGMSQKQIAYHLRRLRAKYPDTEFQVLHASNGEVAIVPKSMLAKTDNQLRQESLQHPDTCTCRWCHERRVDTADQQMDAERENELIAAMDNGETREPEE